MSITVSRGQFPKKKSQLGFCLVHIPKKKKSHMLSSNFCGFFFFFRSIKLLSIIGLSQQEESERQKIMTCTQFPFRKKKFQNVQQVGLFWETGPLAYHEYQSCTAKKKSTSASFFFSASSNAVFSACRII